MTDTDKTLEARVTELEQRVSDLYKERDELLEYIKKLAEAINAVRLTALLGI